MEQIKDLTDKLQLPKLSLTEVLTRYSHIELTEDELNEAIIWAKQRKESRLKQEEIKRKQDENRKKLTETKWSVAQTESFMQYRADNIFEKKFVIDENNKLLFELLCHYFSSSESFVGLAENIGIKNASLDKGVFLGGNFGVGKTWMMKLFTKNQRQVYHIHNAKSIADDYEKGGQYDVDPYVNKIKNAINDATCFYQPYAGLCIDDMGTEAEKTNYGNKKNVVGDLIEKRYAAGNCGVYFHATSNLSGKQLSDFYGGRVVSRMREVLNFIELKGNDRRE